MRYRTSRLEEVKNNIVNIIVKIVLLLLLFVGIIGTEDSTSRLLFEICFVFLLIHAIYWIFMITEPTTYEISEWGIRWVNRWRKGFASWDRIYIKSKGDKAIICIRFAFLVVKTVILPREMIKKEVLRLVG
jgi:glycerol uptake facilitator-like aquaporin